LEAGAKDRINLGLALACGGLHLGVDRTLLSRRGLAI
jgi:hypothetical protein